MLEYPTIRIKGEFFLYKLNCVLNQSIVDTNSAKVSSVCTTRCDSRLNWKLPKIKIMKLYVKKNSDVTKLTFHRLHS